MSNNRSSTLNRETHEKTVMIENLIWEIAKIIEPNSYIDPEKVKHAKTVLFKILS